MIQDKCVSWGKAYWYTSLTSLDGIKLSGKMLSTSFTRDFENWAIIMPHLRLFGVLLACDKIRREFESVLRFARYLVAEEPQRGGPNWEEMQFCHLLVIMVWH